MIGLSWPAFILLTIFTDKLFAGLSPIIYHKYSLLTQKTLVLMRHGYKVLLFLTLFYFLSSSFLTIILNFSTISELIAARMATIRQENPALSLQAQFIRSTSQSNEPVLILSNYATELSLYTNHIRPVNVPSFSELGLKADVEKINAFLLHPPKNAKIYWGPDFELIDPHHFANLVQTTSTDGLIMFENISQ